MNDWRKINRLIDAGRAEEFEKAWSECRAEGEGEERERSRKRREWEETRRALDEMQNTDERLVLSLRYLGRRKWREIAQEMRYSERHILRIHGKAVQNLRLQ